jgi:hypothetical protein
VLVLEEVPTSLEKNPETVVAILDCVLDLFVLALRESGNFQVGNMRQYSTGPVLRSVYIWPRASDLRVEDLSLFVHFTVSPFP